MSFVKDGDSRTRGVGAVAAMDAASPGRRLAAARAARALARRDALMSRSTLGRAPLLTSPATGGTYGARSIDVDPFGRGAGGLKQPSGPTGGGGRPLPPKPKPPTLPGRGGLFAGRIVKSPGSVIDTEPTKGSTGTKAPFTSTEPTKGSTKGSTSSGGGGGSGGGGSGGGGSGGGANVGPLEPLPEEPPAPEEPTPPAPEPAKPKTSGNLLMYAALGVGAWWLLTRTK